jgi:hypothetical protein
LTPEFALEISKFQNSEYEVHQPSQTDEGQLKSHSVALKTAEISSKFRPTTGRQRRVTHGNLIFRSELIFTCHIWNMREVLVSCRENWIFFITDFHVLGLFMAKKHDLSGKKIPSVKRRCRCRWKNLSRHVSVPMEARKLKFWLPLFFGPTWCTSYSEFWN